MFSQVVFCVIGSSPLTFSASKTFNKLKKGGSLKTLDSKPGIFKSDIVNVHVCMLDSHIACFNAFLSCWWCFSQESGKLQFNHIPSERIKGLVKKLNNSLDVWNTLHCFTKTGFRQRTFAFSGK